MRVSRAEAEKVRKRLVVAAGKLLREQGFEVGVRTVAGTDIFRNVIMTLHAHGMAMRV